MANAIDISDPNFEQQMEEMRQRIVVDNYDDPVVLIERVYQLWWHWANFDLLIVNPVIEPISPPLIIEPELIGDNEYEFVYTILDWGHRLSTSKAQDMYTAGMSMCKLYFTIEKMIYLLIERLKSGGTNPETEVQVAFSGHEKAQRKAFESIINLNYNVVVTNFDPGAWGERYLKLVKTLNDRGYGYPSESPRQPYLQHASSGPKVSR
ncbi:virulence protein [Legionella busanensis]|uniref:Virulence protein n=1 Tax=Legionella busanensis TaxID=190655 RepID=A0A378JR50_9GAMM|nr:virulence factor [Legionella busanensis]STX52723.1 virulence protein [Legionella busanensis]